MVHNWIRSRFIFNLKNNISLGVFTELIKNIGVKGVQVEEIIDFDELLSNEYLLIYKKIEIFMGWFFYLNISEIVGIILMY